MLIYTVKNSDTLWQIAKEHRISLDALLAANPQISDPNYVLSGAMLNIPQLFRTPMHAAPAMEPEHASVLPWGSPMDMAREQEPEREMAMEQESETVNMTGVAAPTAAPYCAAAEARPCILVTRGGETLASISEEWDIPLAQLHYHNYQYAKNSRLPGGERIILPKAPDYRIDMNRYGRNHNPSYRKRR